MELCHFVSLESLNLHHNCIRVIPEAIVNLQMLTYLNLRWVNSKGGNEIQVKMCFYFYQFFLFETAHHPWK